MLRSLISTARFLVLHPVNKKNRLRALNRFAKWQVLSRMQPGFILFPYVGGAELLCRRGLTAATGNLYSGLMEFDDMSFLLHFLRSGDVFADIGANIGSYTVLASNVCGAFTYAFEPSSESIKILEKNIALNRIGERVNALAVALSDKQGSATFTVGLDCVNRIAESNVPMGTKTETVKTTTLDCAMHNVVPALIKLDVEGHEASVLRGGRNVLSSDICNAVICEINDGADVGRELEKYGFSPMFYNGERRELKKYRDETRYRSSGNQLFIKRADVVQDRISSARTYDIYGVMI